MTTIDETHAIDLPCWVDNAMGHPDFPVQNLPLGIFSPANGSARPGVAIGDHILDLAAIGDHLPDAVRPLLGDDCLNRMLALPATDRVVLRRTLSRLLCDRDAQPVLAAALHAQAHCTLHLPARIGDYTDFYVGIHHATNVGTLFRPDNPLLPNYKYVPIGYHGRASSVRPSGIAVVRPSGQSRAPDASEPRFGPTARLDYELELGIWIGEGNALGDPVPIDRAADHIAGFCLLNDWSARDFQAWEYVPLGPFLAKSFHSTISPWVVTPEALAPFRMPQPPRAPGDPAPLPYLLDPQDQAQGALALDLGVFLSTARMREAGLPPFRLSTGTAAAMYWTAAQIVAHHASNGCNLNPGDLLGTGTLSGSDRDSLGSLLEITRGGQAPVDLPSGERRIFLEDGDEVTLEARAHRDGFASIGFGECRARIAPAHA